MSKRERVEQLATWLVDNGYAEERPGYGHIAGERLAEALLDSDWSTASGLVDEDQLVGWLVECGYAEERPGYGHIDGARLAEALVADQRRWRTPADED